MPNHTILVDHERIAHQRRLRRWLKRGGVVALVLLLVFFAARPVRHAIKSWQARRHAANAMHLIDEGKWTEANNEARSAYQLRSSEPDAIRAVARLLSRSRQPEALGFWKALREKQPLTREDLRDETTAALAAGNVGLAEIAIKQLSGKMEGGPRAADYLLAAEVAAANGRGEDAANDLKKIVADPKATKRQQLQAAILQLTIGPPNLAHGKETQAEAWKRLTGLARGQDDVGLDALTILAQHALSTPNEIVLDPAIMPNDELERALATHPLSRTPQKLLALDLEMHADPARREEFIQQAIDTWRSGDNGVLATLARWLNGKGEYQRELDTIPLQRALQTRDLFLQRLDALGALGQWAEIKRLLQDETFPLDPVIERMYLARCNQQLNETTASENNWQRAFEATGGDAQKLLTLADYAEKNGASKIAELAYNTIARDNPGVRPAQQGRLRFAQQSRDTRKIHRILTEMLKQWPNDTAIQNDEAYTRLLLMGKAETLKTEKPKSDGGTTAVASDLATLNSQLSTIELLAEDLVRREPASLPHRSLLALARLRLGEPVKALEVYRGLRVPPHAASPSAVAVHAAVLAANGQEQNARTEASAIKPEQLLPEEQALIAKLTTDN